MKFGHDSHAKNCAHAKNMYTQKICTRKKLCARKKYAHAKKYVHAKNYTHAKNYVHAKNYAHAKNFAHTKNYVHKIICDTFWQFLAIIGNFIGLLKKWGIKVSGTVFQSITFPDYNNFGIKFQPLRILNNFSL